VRYAVISDVHGNLEALATLFEKLRPTDGMLCLGDLVGYGPNPNECVEMVRARATATVLGNHDVAAIDNFGIAYFNPMAREAMAWTQTILSAENKEWLNSLGYEFRMAEYLMVHGAPVNYFEYILDKDGAAGAFARTDAPLIFIGHTHIAECYTLHPSGKLEHRHLQHGGEVTLEPGLRYLINVGSVGQPRDLNPQASFAFYEPEAAKVTVERFDYPIAAVQAKIGAAHLPDALARRLVMGR
jgi:predicted phosphodiesterase